MWCIKYQCSRDSIINVHCHGFAKNESNLMILVTWRCSELQTLLHHTMVSLHENYLSVVMGLIIIGWYFFLQLRLCIKSFIVINLTLFLKIWNRDITFFYHLTVFLKGITISMHCNDICMLFFSFESSSSKQGFFGALKHSSFPMFIWLSSFWL